MEKQFLFVFHNPTGYHRTIGSRAKMICSFPKWYERDLQDKIVNMLDIMEPGQYLFVFDSDIIVCLAERSSLL